MNEVFSVTFSFFLKLYNSPFVFSRKFLISIDRDRIVEGMIKIFPLVANIVQNLIYCLVQPYLGTLKRLVPFDFCFAFVYGRILVFNFTFFWVISAYTLSPSTVLSKLLWGLISLIYAFDLEKWLLLEDLTIL